MPRGKRKKKKVQTLENGEKKRNPVGRPSKKTTKLLEKIVELSRKGKTVAQIGEILDLAPATIKLWMFTDIEFSTTVRQARQEADEMVEASLFRRALGYSAPEEKVFCDKGHLITYQTMKHYPPDTEAAKFWLANRKPKDWKHKVTHAGDESEPIKVIVEDYTTNGGSQ